MTTMPPGSPGAHHTGTSSGSSNGHARDRVREDLHRTVDDARRGAADNVAGIAGSIDAAAAQLGREDMTRLSGYVHEMAQSLAGLAGNLRERSGDEMIQDISTLARRKPALFLGGSVALGFGLSRFARAGRARPDRQLPVPMDQADTPASAGAAATQSAVANTGDLP